MLDSDRDEISHLERKLRRALTTRALLAIALGLAVATMGVLALGHTEGLSPRVARKRAAAALIMTSTGIASVSVGGVLLVRTRKRR